MLALARRGGVVLPLGGPPRAGGALVPVVALVAWLAGCSSAPTVADAPQPPRPADVKLLIDRVLPERVADRAGWVTDLYAAFSAQQLDPSKGNVCAVVAVIEQESGFRADPVVPGLGAIAWKEIDRRAAAAGLPSMLVHAALQLPSSNGHSYADRIGSARTERDLSDAFEDFIGRVPLGQTLFAGANPIRTRGPMQVNIAFVERYTASHPYPYPVARSAADEAFTRRGGVYFGVAHLLDYPAAYDRILYRFADYNAGQYASRNAAFQRAVTSASGIPVIPDGALLAHDSSARNAGSTELAVDVVAARIGLSPAAIHADLERGKEKAFEATALYQRLYELAERAEGRPLARAAVPQIQLSGPKITRDLSTEWYANRVHERYTRCMGR
ncbi:MAG: DUF1615 domain-containing protein [Pseudomonadota bacterium]|nr:DUF1615 domain-containing protein [Pseudomonadota bacterium]